MGNLLSNSRVTIRWQYAVNVQLMERYEEFIVLQQSNYKFIDKKSVAWSYFKESVNLLPSLIKKN